MKVLALESVSSSSSFLVGVWPERKVRDRARQRSFDRDHRFSRRLSGSVPASQRPWFQKLMERMEQGDTLILTKLDRIGRDSIDVQQTVSIFEKLGMRLIVLQLGTFDLTSSAGSLMVKVLAAVADFER
jgi:putative DNA-invertase from lambdoid prophage Rac